MAVYLDVTCPTCGTTRPVQRYRAHRQQVCARCCKAPAARKRPKPAGSTSTHRGVYYRPDRIRTRRPWVAVIYLDGRPYQLGYFGQEEWAVEAYQRERRRQFGDDEEKKEGSAAAVPEKEAVTGRSEKICR